MSRREKETSGTTEQEIRSFLESSLPVRLCTNPGCPNWKNLQACANCKAVRYCSRECQKQDWIQHKPSCLLYTASGNDSSNETRLQRHLRLWTGRFERSLTHATIAALDLQRNPSNIDKYGIIILLEPRRHREAGSRFTMKFAELVPMSEFETFFLQAAGGNRAGLEEHARQRAALKQRSGGRDDYATMLVIADNTEDQLSEDPTQKQQIEARFKPIVLSRSLVQSPQFRDPSPDWRETLMKQAEDDLPNRIIPL